MGNACVDRNYSKYDGCDQPFCTIDKPHSHRRDEEQVAQEAIESQIAKNMKNEGNHIFIKNTSKSIKEDDFL